MIKFSNFELFLFAIKDPKLTKVEGSETAHLRAGPPFSCISLDWNIFSSFFSRRKLDEDSNPSHFIIFGAFVNYL